MEPQKGELVLEPLISCLSLPQFLFLFLTLFSEGGSSLRIGGLGICQRSDRSPLEEDFYWGVEVGWPAHSHAHLVNELTLKMGKVDGNG